MSEPKIITEYVFPPIPLRHWDWRAYREDWEEPGDPMGEGPTEQAAIADLLATESDAEETQP